MTSAELRTIREVLGLSAQGLAALCRVRDRTVRRWEAGEWPVPADAAALVLDWHQKHAAMAAWCIKQARQSRASIRLARWGDGPSYVASHADAEGMDASLALQLHHGLLARVVVLAEMESINVEIVAAA